MDSTLKTWFFHQCRLVSGLTRAALLTGPPDLGPYDRPLFWPPSQNGNTVNSSLSRVAQAALAAKKVVIKTRHSTSDNTGEPLDAMASPLILSGQLVGVLAIEMAHRSQSSQQHTAQQVHIGIKWLEAMIQLQGSAAKVHRTNIVDMVAVGLDNGHFKIAAAEVANELSQRFKCHRVSLGFLNHQKIHIEAVSHCSRIDQHANEIQALKDAMHEALDQDTSIVYPTTSDAIPLITRFHTRLADSQQSIAICTLPLVKNGKAVGALLLERPADNPFDAETVSQCEQIALLLGPVLANRRREEKPLLWKIMDALRNAFCGVLGPRRLALKISVGLCALLLIWLSLTGTPLRISCDTELEATICRVIAAPQQGYIAEAHVRTGDLVQKGDLLATLDDKELRLEQRKWQSQRAQLRKEYRKALSGLDRAEVAIINAKRAQAEAQLSLIDQQLARTTLLAPFSGLVVKGDLSQALGSPVTRGEVLYEVAPTDGYRVVLRIDDRDIGLVSLGQRGQMKLTGIPHRAIDITIDRLTPVATVEEGRNLFRVEAVMEDHSDLMRPGMKGIAKIEVGHTKRIWAWARPLVDWLRLFAWNWMP